MHIIKLLFVFIMSTARWPATTTAGASPHITILGSVYCDVCHTHLSKHSHFLQGVEVNIECKFKTSSSRKHVVSVSVNKTTDVHGIYKLDIRPVEGIHCSDYPTIQSFCRARLIGQTRASSECNVGSTNHTSNHITLKSKQNNVCIYILEALSYKPLTRININAASSCRIGLDYYSFNSSKFFFPPPFVITWPCPQLPPFPISFPLPFPWPYPYQWIPNPPSLPFPFPPLPSPPPVTLGDPRTWIPNFPLSPPPQQLPAWDPRTWIPHPPPTTQNP